MNSQHVKNGAPTIGIFDSGLGGLSVAREIRELLPYNDIVYLADTAHCPYGTRTPDELLALSLACSKWLRDRGTALMVVACNTASAAALQHLRTWAGPSWPIIGLVPAVKTAVEHTQSRCIGLLATRATLQGPLVAEVVNRFALPEGVTVLTASSSELVVAVENADLHSSATRELLRALMDPMLESGVDALVLGSTHYVFLRSAIEDLYGPALALFDSGRAVARQTLRVLSQHSPGVRGSEPGTLSIFTTGDPVRVRISVEKLLGEELDVKKAVLS